MVSWDPQFTSRVTERDWGHEGVRPGEVTPVDPLRSLDLTSFARRHVKGTQKEFLLDKEVKDAFNRRAHSFKAWPIFYIRQLPDSAVLLFLVESSDHDSMLPKEGEKCEIMLQNEFEKSPATRVDNPCSMWRVRNDTWEKRLAFHVHLKGKARIMRAFPNLRLARGRRDIPRESELRSQRVSFELRMSTSTRNAELGAHYTLEQGRTGQWNGHSQWQIDAYKYVVCLESPTGYMRLLERFPHMVDPFERPESTSPRLVELVQSLNDQQKYAFQETLSEIPNGVCVIHGVPGSGKTHFNLVVAAALQSKDEIQFAGSQSLAPSSWNNKVLYLIDINKPLTDAANKMARLYNDLALTKRSRIDGSIIPRIVIRMHCWSYEKLTATRKHLEAQTQELNRRMQQHEGTNGNRQRSGDHVNGNNTNAATLESSSGQLQQHHSEADDSEEVEIHRFAPAFQVAENAVRTRTGREAECVAPTLDEAAWALFDKFKDTRYRRLQSIRRHTDLPRGVEFNELENEELEKLYQDALMDADIVFTTPVSASKFSSSMFSPTVIIFDEASHARELSTLIAVAKFNPAAWIFSGDVRQTKPFVRSFGNRPCRNEYAPQLTVSMMARSLEKYPDAPGLNINHRAHGNLQKLPSTLFYDDKMVPATDPAQPGGVPPSTAYLRRKYIMPMKRNEGNECSRLLVSLRDPGAAQQPDDTSWWHPGHQRWVMDLILKLLRDHHFKQTSGSDPGTILVISPYKASFNQYRKAILELKDRHPPFKDRIVEARTIDSAQGHEADVVILDFVRQRPTSHLEDRNRLCVALTRARQMELVLMHPDLIRAVERGRGSCLKDIVSLCKGAGEYISDPAQLDEERQEPVAASATTAQDALDLPDLDLHGLSSLLGSLNFVWRWFP